MNAMVNRLVSVANKLEDVSVLLVGSMDQIANFLELVGAYKDVEFAGTMWKFKIIWTTGNKCSSLNDLIDETKHKLIVNLYGSEELTEIKYEEIESNPEYNFDGNCLEFYDLMNRNWIWMDVLPSVDWFKRCCKKFDGETLQNLSEMILYVRKR